MAVFKVSNPALLPVSKHELVQAMAFTLMPSTAIAHQGCRPFRWPLGSHYIPRPTMVDRLVVVTIDTWRCHGL
jgi:hypothetical protein